jgi:uncharacterized SAM-binding protein YcdF (DUF218 family)
MFFVLSKTLFYLLMPMTWIVGFLLYAIFTKYDKRRKRSIIAATVLLIFFGNGFIINEAFRWWEVPATPIAEIPQTYDVGIVLTGITSIDQQPRDRVYFEKGADRIMHALHLYKIGKVRHILISGGSGNVVGSKESEAEELAQVLLMCGVPERDITIENQSRNTRENAVFSGEVLNRKFPGQSYLLITSAFHMRRAEGCFRKAQVPVTVFSTDFYAKPRKYTPDRLFIPSEGALSKWFVLCHEMLGYLMYRIVGYAG